ncbi:Helitron helicase [Phytophthora megakarya]|uniref:Helitron helicase n=1 Tax=Phytophthora megakarya TaxID=4795 RepID=A0A225WEW3_9STRA|nr:Helitron helicase [Phytophthora megakarya]
MAQQTKKPATAIQDVHLVIIDKFSVISCGMLHWIDERMKKIWPLQRHLPFPAVPYALSTPLRQVYNDVQRKGRELWEAIPHVCMLTDQNRGKRDLDWFDALRRLRRRRPTTADIELINPRCCSGDCLPAEYSKAKHIAHKNVDVDTSNDERLHASNASIVPIHALHHGQQKRLHQQQEIPEGTVSALVNEAKSPQSARDRVVATKLTLCLGAPVTFTINLDQSAGLCNGTNGVIYDLIFIAGTDLPIVLVKVTGLYLRPSFLKDVPSIVLVVPREVSCGKKNSDLRVIRRGIPFATGERYSHSHGPMLIVRQGRVS